MRFIPDILDVTCRRATELAELRLQAPLSVTDTLRFRVHTSLCTACRRYAEHSLLIERMLRQHSVAVPDPLADGKAAETLTETILKKLP